MTFVEVTSVLGNLGEFIGAFAVVVTLIYLAMQVRLSKEATEANTRLMEENHQLSLVENYMRRSERVEAGYRDNALSSEMSRLVYKATTDFESLDEFELYRLREWSHAHMHRLDAQHYQYQHGLLEDEAYQNLRRALARYAPTWKLADIQPPRQSFQDEIDDVLSNDS
jgi:hypothetical protein